MTPVQHTTTWSHIIPVVYLKAWRDRSAGQPAQVWLFDRESLRGSLQPCKEVLGAINFYLTVDDQGRPSDHIEMVLGLAESRFGFIRRGLELQRTLGTTDRDKLWEFVAGMFVRTLSWRRWLDTAVRACCEIVVEAIRRNPEAQLEAGSGRRLSPQERQLLGSLRGSALLEFATRAVQPRLQGVAMSLVSPMHAAIIRAGLGVIKELPLPFCIVRAKNGNFISSDAPCFLEDQSHSIEVPRDSAVGALFVLPLSPKMAFVGGRGVREGDFSVDGRWVARFNGRVRGNADQWLVGNTQAITEADLDTTAGAPPTMREVAEQTLLKVLADKSKELLQQ